MSDHMTPFTAEELQSLPSRVLIHGTPDGNKATLDWDDYSRLYESAKLSASDRCGAIVGGRLDGAWCALPSGHDGPCAVAPEDRPRG